MSMGRKIADKLWDELKNRPEWRRMEEFRRVIDYVCDRLRIIPYGKAFFAATHKEYLFLSVCYKTIARDVIKSLKWDGHDEQICDTVLRWVEEAVDKEFEIFRPLGVLDRIKSSIEKSFASLYDYRFCGAWEYLVGVLGNEMWSSDLSCIKEFVLRVKVGSVCKDDARDRGFLEASEVVLKYCDAPGLLDLPQSLQEIKKNVQR